MWKATQVTYWIQLWFFLKLNLSFEVKLFYECLTYVPRRCCLKDRICCFNRLRYLCDSVQIGVFVFISDIYQLCYDIILLLSFILSSLDDILITFIFTLSIDFVRVQRTISRSSAKWIIGSPVTHAHNRRSGNWWSRDKKNERYSVK